MEVGTEVEQNEIKVNQTETQTIQNQNQMSIQEKPKNNKKPLIIGIAIFAVVALAIILTIIFINSRPLDSSYFVSDGSKYVVSFEHTDQDENKYSPKISHLVYYYSGNEITGLRAFYEYPDEESAKQAFDFYSVDKEKYYKDVLLDGVYVIIIAKNEEYKDLTAEDVKRRVESVEKDKEEESEEEAEEENEDTVMESITESEE